MAMRIAAAALAALLAASVALAQDLAKVVTKADVEMVTGLNFKDGTKPMATQILFAQDGGDLRVSVDVEPREVSRTVRGWEATMKTMQPTARVATVPGVGKDAIYYSTRADLGALDADFDQPRVQLRVAVGGVKSPDQAKKIAVDLAKVVGPRVGK
jgi:hypothetical protein